MVFVVIDYVTFVFSTTSSIVAGMTDVFAIAQIFIDHIKATCPNDVCIVAAYGSYLHGTPSQYSDLDLYYIPEPGKGDDLYRSFVAFDLPFEFWGVSWEFAEKIAAGKHRWSIAPAIIANARVLHARSDADLQRYRALQQQIADLQQPASKPNALTLAGDALRQAHLQHGLMAQAADGGDLVAARWAGCNFIDDLLDCLCLINQSHLTRYWASDATQLTRLTQQPADLQTRITQLITANEPRAIAQHANQLLQETRVLWMDEQRRQAQPEPANAVLRDYYAAVKEYVNKLLSDCEKRNLVSAAFVATKMQVEMAGLLMRMGDGIVPTDLHRYGEISMALRDAGFPDLTAAINASDFGAIRQGALDFDTQTRRLFAQHQVSLQEFHDLPVLQDYLCGLRAQNTQ